MGSSNSSGRSARLVGAWQEEGAKDVVWIAADGQDRNGYVLTDDHDEQVSAHLLRLNDALFLDLEENNRRHFFTRTWITEREIRFSTLRRCWLDKRIARREIAGHVSESLLGETVLTAGTKNLQSFVLIHLNEKDAFSEEHAFHRAEPRGAD